MTAEDAIRDYYDALRGGEALEPFVHDEALVKYGVSEALYGREEIVDGLRTQTETTADWTVESRRLRVDEREKLAVFGDEVRLAWTDEESGSRHDFETRWSGALAREDGRWKLLSLHVSAPREL